MPGLIPTHDAREKPVREPQQPGDRGHGGENQTVTALGQASARVIRTPDESRIERPHGTPRAKDALAPPNYYPDQPDRHDFDCVECETGRQGLLGRDTPQPEHRDAHQFLRADVTRRGRNRAR